MIDPPPPLPPPLLLLLLLLFLLLLPQLWLNIWSVPAIQLCSKKPGVIRNHASSIRLRLSRPITGKCALCCVHCLPNKLQGDGAPLFYLCGIPR